MLSISGDPNDVLKDKRIELLEKLRARATKIAPVPEEGSFKDSMDFERVWGMSSLSSKESLAERFLTVSLGEFLKDYSQLEADDPEAAADYLDSVIDPSRVHINELDMNGNNQILAIARRKLNIEYGMNLPENQLQQYIVKRYIADYQQHIKNSPEGFVSNLLHMFPNMAGEIIGAFEGDFPMQGLGKIASLASMVYAGGFGFRLGRLLGLKAGERIGGVIGLATPPLIGMGVEAYTLGVPDHIINSYLVNPMRAEIGLPELAEPKYLDNLAIVGTMGGLVPLIKLGVSGTLIKSVSDLGKSIWNKVDIPQLVINFGKQSVKVLKPVFSLLTKGLTLGVKQVVKGLSVFLNRIFALVSRREVDSHHTHNYVDGKNASLRRRRSDEDILREIDSFSTAFNSSLDKIKSVPLSEEGEKVISEIEKLLPFVSLLKNSVVDIVSHQGVDNIKYPDQVIGAHNKLVEHVKNMAVAHNVPSAKPGEVLKTIYSDPVVRELYNNYLKIDKSPHEMNNDAYKNTLLLILHDLKFSVDDLVNDKIILDTFPDFYQMKFGDLMDVLDSIMDIANAKDAS
ncbi:MAG: hypothetical protein ACRCST_13565 [Turicibacter sp.]